MTKNDRPSAASPIELTNRLDAEIYRQAVDVAPVPMIVVRGDGIIVLVNTAAIELFGYQDSELVGQSVEILVPQGLRSAHIQHREGFAHNSTTRPMGLRRDLEAVTREGVEIPVEVGLSPVDTSGGLMVICAIVDLTIRKRTEEELAELAALLGKKNETLLELVATDSLTSLKSRRAFLDHLAGQIDVSLRHMRPFSVLLLDIDNFKRYNDNFGHLAGDEVLRQFGRILRATARRSDFVARLGGEEFGIILPETDEDGARTLGERFRIAIETDDWPRRPITTSVGAMTVRLEETIPRPQAPEVSQILSRADRALYHSKDAGRNRVTHVVDLPNPTKEAP